jgi:hypothetical protein
MYVVVLISFILLCLKIASKISNKNFEELFLIGFILYTTSIITTGYVLSALTIWNNSFAWAVMPFIAVILLYNFFRLPLFASEQLNTSTFKITGRAIQKLHEVYKSSSKTEKVAFLILLIAFILLHGIQLAITYYTPPNEWDSMTGHLNRILYFLQNGSTKHFIGTNWNIDTYPKSFSSIQVYPFLMTNWNEHFFKLPNLSAYWIMFIGSYALLKRIQLSFISSVFCSSLVLFIPIVVIQSTSTDTDIVLAAYLISLVYFLISFKYNQQAIYIYLSALTFSIALSHKITFVFSFIPIFILIIYIIRHTKFLNWKNSTRHFILAHILFISIITLPTGYISNYIHYGHPIGPKTATQHQSIERAGSFSNLLRHGSRNFIRYQFDLLNLDGLRNIEPVEHVQKKIKPIFHKLDQGLNLGLEREVDFTIIPFTFNRRFEFYNGTPIYGLFYFLFVLPALIYMFKKRSDKIFKYFLVAYIFHVLALSFTAAYDPWKGRYMLSSLVFLLPIVGNFLHQGALFQRSHFGKSYLIVSAIFISLTGLTSIVYHIRALPFGAYGKPSIFKLTRMDALTISRPDLSNAYTKFDKIVPQGATVALATINDDYEYPLWGNKFTRKLIPINPFEQGLQPIPVNAEYLFFAKSVIEPLPGDINLGTSHEIKLGVVVPAEDYYLRKLK